MSQPPPLPPLPPQKPVEYARLQDANPSSLFRGVVAGVVLAIVGYIAVVLIASQSHITVSDKLALPLAFSPTLLKLTVSILCLCNPRWRRFGFGLLLSIAIVVGLLLLTLGAVCGGLIVFNH